jgi:hypothetical protein
VLLGVLALAAATGAMFGVVVFGNEFTKDVHPMGDTYANSVTLVDTNDRAIATADVESYVSLLDLPLLGTAELNKIDGITFSTHQGVEHRKVTGYTFTQESSFVDGSTVSSPRLSLRSEPGVTIEVSTRDSKAWMLHVTDKSSIETPIETSSQRRLGDGSGSCLANGACLYSHDELLRADAETRQLSEGSFFARADLAAYQVELNGENLMQYLSAVDAPKMLSGVYTQDGHSMLVRASRASEETALYLENTTDQTARLITVNGSFFFSDDELTACAAPKKSSKAAPSLTLNQLQEAIDFDSVKITASEGNIPHCIHAPRRTGHAPQHRRSPAPQALKP